MSLPEFVWRTYAARLAASPALDGAWSDAFASIPRHHFIAAEHIAEGERWVRHDPPSDPAVIPGWLVLQR